MTATAPARRRCYWIDPTQDPGAHDGWVPSLVIENEPGHSPLTGDGNALAAPIVWGQTLDQAEGVCERQNQLQFDLSPKDALLIVMSSIAAGNPDRGDETEGEGEGGGGVHAHALEWRIETHTDLTDHDTSVGATEVTDRHGGRIASVLVSVSPHDGALVVAVRTAPHRPTLRVTINDEPAHSTNHDHDHDETVATP